MNRAVCWLSLVGIVLGAVPVAHGQTCEFSQPWTPPRPPYQSRVVGCSQPTAEPKIALDDFICHQSARLVRVTWWGWLSARAQGSRNFYIAIYNNLNCTPTARVYWACVRPDFVVHVGADCQPARLSIYRMTAALPGGFLAAAETRYWLQISEDDSDSLTANEDDFKWAAHRPEEGVIPACWAKQAPPLADLPLDPCDAQKNELAFYLSSRTIFANNPVPPLVLDTPLRWNLRLPADVEVLVESGVVDVSKGGSAVLVPHVPDGPYILEVYVAGAEPVRASVLLQAGTEAVVQMPPACIGDSNGDGIVNNFDIDKFVECLTRF